MGDSSVTSPIMSDDPDFLADIEKAITNVGTDQHWVRKVGGRDIWFSPIPVSAQTKINELMVRKELASNVVLETKRTTLSYAIVGIDNFDLRKFRFSNPTLQIRDKSGKLIQVSLDRYIYEKIVNWSGQFVDDAFSVFADLNESHQKNNLKDISFENLKDPHVELLELEVQVREIRKMLGMPNLVEAGSESARAQEETTPEDDEQELPEDDSDEEPSSEPESFASKPEEFNPFKTVRQDKIPDFVLESEKEMAKTRAQQDGPVRPSSPMGNVVPSQEFVRQNFPQSNSPPAPTPVLPSIESSAKPMRLTDIPGVHNPGFPDDVLEAPAPRATVAPPVIDGNVQSRNPRFSPTRR